MTHVFRLTLALCLLVIQIPSAYAKEEAAASIAQGLVTFSSDEGLARLARSTAKVDFPSIANQFEAQSNAAFCGPTSAAIVLNTVHGRSDELPHDRSRLRPEDLRYVPSTFDPSLPRFTQDNVITKGKKTRAQVLGEPVTINGKQAKDFGYQIRQLDEMLRANGLDTKLVIVDESRSEQDIRADLVENLERRGDYVIVAYLREESSRCSKWALDFAVTSNCTLGTPSTNQTRRVPCSRFSALTDGEFGVFDSAVICA